jgi:hypothetical protein
VNKHRITDTFSLQSSAGLAMLLFFLGIVSRIPFQSQILHHWDSINFALALEYFDLRLHQPHPPGMFVLYILFGRLLNYFIQDPNSSLVWISILATGFSAAMIFLLGEAWYGKVTGIVIALVMLSSPIVWFHGEVGLSYMPEFLWVLLIVFACYHTGRGNKWALFAATILMGLAGGIRPNTPFFMFPLWVAAVTMGLGSRKYHIRHLVMAILLGIVGVLFWLTLMIQWSGGLTDFIEVMEWWRSQHVEDAGSAEGLLLHIARLTMYTIYGLGIIIIPLIIAFFTHLRQAIVSLRSQWSSQILAIWVIPALSYFVFVHIRQPGHTFTIMPAFMILGGVSTVVVAKLFFVSAGRWAVIAVTAMFIIINTAFFLLTPSSLFGSSRLIFSLPTWATIKEYDRYVGDKLDAIRTTFDPAETVVIADGRNFRIPDYYLSDFQGTSLSYRLREEPIILPENVQKLVLFDETLQSRYSSNAKIEKITLPNRNVLLFVTWQDGQTASLSNSKFIVTEKD